MFKMSDKMWTKIGINVRKLQVPIWIKIGIQDEKCQITMRKQIMYSAHD